MCWCTTATLARSTHPSSIRRSTASFFSPDPEMGAHPRILLPHCGTMVETEYAIPGHPPSMTWSRPPCAKRPVGQA
ncbi:acetone carboxylase subunit gamma [Zoogloea sp.]|uniref:acetone carboxylase subunit gamma n=1 Tax=Zoogloea sp. TaxID=49181 RepID=UPI00345C21A9